MTWEKEPGNIYDTIPENVKNFLERNPAPFDVTTAIIEAFQQSKKYTILKLNESIDELKDEISKKIKHKSINTMKKFISENVKAWNIELEKENYWVGWKIIITDWENSIKISINTDFGPEDWAYIRGCFFDFKPNNISEENKLNLLERFYELL